ncbi:PKD domain-containing protein [Edaphocola aurantiacus]|uniref:PKD domain-containing protein n=1 Tax=Edaphocola aurantiacus TaxID=2601682 RepID=UPI001C958BA0|nr:PKD domain-containing protein [Edaphocola aurantiacus]
MRKAYAQLLCTILCLFGGINAFASHIVGGEITYKFISTTGTNHTYQVQVIIYGDCSGGSFPSFTGSTSAGLNIYKAGVQQGAAVNLPRINAESDILISPVCATQLSSTTCSPGGTIVGVKKFTFRGNIVIAGTSNDWRFAFNGDLVSSTAGRSALIQNTVGASGTTMYIGATLNNVNGPNTTPTFTSDPSPFFCLNIPQSYSLGAVETEGDGLAYSLVGANTNAVGTTNMTYVAGYTATTPLPAAPGTFLFSGTTGQTDFTPNALVNCVVVNKVTETRNGVEVGSCCREMLFVMLQNCANTSPSTPVSGAQNGDLLPSTPSSVQFETCEAQTSTFAFDVPVTDAQGDNVTITATNIPSGAVFNVTNNGTPNPTAHFSWILNTVAAGTYQFFITYKDDGCPLSSIKTVTYTVYVLPFNGDFQTGSQPPCRDMINGKAWITQSATDTAKYKITWMDPAFNVLRAVNFTDQGDTFKNIASGNYVVEVENYRGCKRKFDVIVDTPTYKAKFEVDSIICVNTNLTFNPNFPNNDFVSWSWDFGNGVTSNMQTPTHQYPYSGHYLIKMIGVTSLGCIDSFQQWVTVDSVMTPEFVLDRNTLCAGEQVHVTPDYGLNPTGVSWDFGDGGTLQTGAVTGMTYAYTTPGTYPVAMTVSYRSCPDITYTKNITISSYPLVDLGNDTALCYRGAPITLANQVVNTGVLYHWNTGATTSSIQATGPGVYSLTATNSADCSTTDSVTIRKDCYVDIPNAFSPNGDGVSDYFFPRSLLSRGVSSFEMSVYNRWGEKVFLTQKIDGRGWDGLYSGKVQPAGVYIYDISVKFKDGTEERYQGNVTLIR